MYMTHTHTHTNFGMQTMPGWFSCFFFSEPSLSCYYFLFFSCFPSGWWFSFLLPTSLWNLPFDWPFACSPIARPFSRISEKKKNNQRTLQYWKQSNSINMHARGMWQCRHLISPIENITNHPVVNHRAASRQNTQKMSNSDTARGCQIS